MIVHAGVEKDKTSSRTAVADGIEASPGRSRVETPTVSGAGDKSIDPWYFFVLYTSNICTSISFLFMCVRLPVAAHLHLCFEFHARTLPFCLTQAYHPALVGLMLDIALQHSIRIY